VPAVETVGKERMSVVGCSKGARTTSLCLRSPFGGTDEQTVPDASTFSDTLTAQSVGAPGNRDKC
jgi:hypothetical protein